MPYKDGEPTLGEQFEAASEPHVVSEPKNELEAYRHLQQVEAEHAVFTDTIRYMAENTHQAYHQDSNDGWWACKKNVCTAAQKAIPEYAAWLAGKGPKP
jgi:hypothetical protein